MKKITLLNTSYIIKEEKKDAIDEEELTKDFTDYFTDYDMVVGDWAYGKLRLKGFNKKGHPKYNDINDADKIEEYIKNYCAYDCRYFILEKESSLARNKKWCYNHFRIEES